MRQCGNAAINLDLPIPASPESSTICPSPAFAWAQRRDSRSLSSLRPTNSVRPPACNASKRLASELALSAAKARVGPAMPSRSCGPRSARSNRLPSSFRVPSARGDAVRPGDALQPRRQVLRVADAAAFLRFSRTREIADDHDPRSRFPRAHAASRRPTATSAQPPLWRARPARRARRRARAPADSRNERARRRPCIWRRSRHWPRSRSRSICGYAPMFARMSFGSSRADIAVEPTRSQNIRVR